MDLSQYKLFKEKKQKPTKPQPKSNNKIFTRDYSRQNNTLLNLLRRWLIFQTNTKANITT